MDLIEILLSYGLELNVVVERGLVFIYFVVFNGYVSVLNLFVFKGVNFKVVDD